MTGFASAKVGRMAAFTIGGAIILLEIANEQGIIKIDWNRLTRKADQVGDKVQKAVTGEGPKWMEKVNSQKFLNLLALCISLPLFVFPPRAHGHPKGHVGRAIKWFKCRRMSHHEQIVNDSHEPLCFKTISSRIFFHALLEREFNEQHNFFVFDLFFCTGRILYQK